MQAVSIKWLVKRGSHSSCYGCSKSAVVFAPGLKREKLTEAGAHHLYYGMQPSVIEPTFRQLYGQHKRAAITHNKYQHTSDNDKRATTTTTATTTNTTTTKTTTTTPKTTTTTTTTNNEHDNDNNNDNDTKNNNNNNDND